MRLLLLLFARLLLCSSLCSDQFGASRVLQCAAPLVAYVNPLEPLSTPPHPPLANVAGLCVAYAHYRNCVSTLDQQCRQTTMGAVEKVYDIICATKMLKSLAKHKKCYQGMSTDAALRQCHQNSTKLYMQNMLSKPSITDEDVERAINSTDETGLADAKPFLTMGKRAVKVSSYEHMICQSMQSFIQCMLKHDYWDHCPEALQAEVHLLQSLPPNCSVIFVSPNPDYTLPSCDENAVCTCEHGYVFETDTRYCVDVNECFADPSPCSQRCVNTPGAFKCLCNEQYYVLADDQATCLPKGEDPTWIFFAHGQSIWNISADGKDFQLQRARLQKTAMIDIDYKENRLYFADIGANKVESMEFDGLFSKSIQFYEVDGMEGIAIDWIGRNLYTMRKTSMWVQQLEGRYRTELYRDIVKLPRALVVHPLVGQAFYTDWGAKAFIGRAAMDGSAHETIVDSGVVWPNALAIDYYTDRLYWADAFLDTIESCAMDGSRRRTVIGDASSVPHVFGLAVANDYIYWTDWTYRGILRADKRTGANVTVLAQTALLPYALKVFHTAMQPDLARTVENPCSTLTCEHLCLLGPSDDVNETFAITGVCACPEGFLLSSNGKNCTANCSEKQVLCGGQDPRCISRVYRCDGQSQCWDHEDERECPRRVCLPGQFQCHNNAKCVTADSICDGIAHCDDASDEKFC